jgi:hypothetical protein
MKLGNADYFIRNKGSWSEFNEELKDLGFDYSHKQNKYSYQQVRIALTTYKLIYNETHTPFTIPYGFVVPNDNLEW